jgi:hypothetical protein
MELLGDIGKMEAHFGLFGDSFNHHPRKVHDLRRTYRWLRNHFGHTRWYSYVMWVKWKLISVRLDIVLISTQDRCTGCTECVIGSEIISGASNGTRQDGNGSAQPWPWTWPCGLKANLQGHGSTQIYKSLWPCWPNGYREADPKYYHFVCNHTFK